MNNRKLFNDKDELESSMFNYLNLKKEKQKSGSIKKDIQDTFENEVLEIKNKDDSNEPNGIEPTVVFPEDYNNLGVLGERSDPLLDRTIFLIATGGRTGSYKSNSTLSLDEISDSKAKNPSKGTMFVNFKKK